MYNIKMYIGNYDRTEFYSIMGKFFAERVYKKIMPYLVNERNKICYLFFKDDELAGFCGVNICAAYTNFKDIYVVDKFQNSNLLNFMCRHLFRMYKSENIKVLTKSQNEIDIWLNLGFKDIGVKGKYHNLLREKKYE